MTAESKRVSAKAVRMDGGWLGLVANRLSERARQNLFLRVFGLTQVRMIWWVGARIHEMDADRCVVRIPLTRRTRNHLGSMYIGTLTVGADVAGGFIAADQIRRSGHAISLVFKDLKADYLKRPEGDTLFTCAEGATIRAMVAEAIESGERVHRTVRITATVPAKLGDEPVATFDLTLSLKARARQG